MLRVGNTVRLVCSKAGTVAGLAPMTRYALPSMRTKLVSRCARPVQCVVSTSFNLSPGDQMLKYGSHTTIGVEGGTSLVPSLRRGTDGV